MSRKKPGSPESETPTPQNPSEEDKKSLVILTYGKARKHNIDWIIFTNPGVEVFQVSPASIELLPAKWEVNEVDGKYILRNGVLARKPEGVIQVSPDNGHTIAELVELMKVLSPNGAGETNKKAPIVIPSF